MTLGVIGLLIIAAALAWLVVRRAMRFRREAESREARALEAMLAARQGGGANIDIDMIFDGPPARAAPTSADAVLQAAGLRPEVIALLGKPAGGRAAAEPAMSESRVRAQSAPVAHTSPSPVEAQQRSIPATSDADGSAAQVPVRDLVQVFYEARGFSAAAADPAARPIELVLTHNEDARRSYAFLPLEEPLSEAAVRSIIGRARRIDQLRVLIATEETVAPELLDALPSRGVRVFDRATIEAQLARLEAPTAEKLIARARRRTARRLQETG